MRVIFDQLDFYAVLVFWIDQLVNNLLSTYCDCAIYIRALKFIYSEKATKFCKILPLTLVCMYCGQK